MTILLDTPFDSGDYDNGNTYPRVQLVNIEIFLTSKTVAFTYEYGNMVSGSWERGAGSPSKTVYVNKPNAFDNFMSGSNIEDKVYTYLTSQGITPGTIE